MKRTKIAAVGIITGSGPEAGVDLWNKVLQANRSIKGAEFRGDLDAPEVFIWSRPELGLSMNMDAHSESVWRTLREAVECIAPKTCRYTIACNTLHYFQDRIETMGLGGRFVSVASVVESFLDETRIKSFALIGATPAVNFAKWSPYARLANRFSIELSSSQAAIHSLIGDVKRLGANHQEVCDRFRVLLQGIDSEWIVLACTELPLIPVDCPGKKLVDVTQLLATSLVSGE